MLRVKCRGCGKVYNYQQDEICPNCGAYNRPPHREIVEADGTVRDAWEEEKVCYEETACYEEKQCHEEVARQVRQNDGKTAWETDDLEVALHKGMDKLKTFAEKANRSKKAQTPAQKRRTLIIGVAVAALSLLGNWLDNREWNSEPTPEPGYEAVEVATLQEYRKMGEEIAVDGVSVVVDEAIFEEATIVVQMEVGGDEDWYFEPQLYWHFDDGGETSLWAEESWSEGSEGIRHYKFNLEEHIEYDYTANEEGYFIAIYTAVDEDTQIMYLIPLGIENV